MSQENVDAFKRGIEAYNRRDLESLLEVLDPEIEWHAAVLVGLGGEARVYWGHETFSEGMRDLYDALSELHIEYSEIRDLGQRVVAIGRIRARGRESGAETESAHASVVDFKNGKAIRVHAYLVPGKPSKPPGCRSRRCRRRTWRSCGASTRVGRPDPPQRSRTCCTPDIQWVNPSDALEPGTRAGIEAFTSITEELDDTIGDLRMDV